MKKIFLVIVFVVFDSRLSGQGIIMPFRNDSLASSVFRPGRLNRPTLVKNKISPFPRDFYSSHLPFFCRQELKMQQAHMPVSFRLGSMDDCNFLEQKPGYR
jgi:hypothetical protein